MNNTGANRTELGSSSRRRWPGRGRAARAAVVVLAAALAACGDREERAETQPAPAVTTFEQGTFGDIPLFPRSDPVGPRTEEDGVVVRSFRARGTTSEEVVEYYRDVLAERRWELVGSIEKIGVDTYRADWVKEGQSLRVSATPESSLGDGDPSDEVTVQYSLMVRPA